MPSKASHKNLADKNLALIDDLRAGHRHPEWAATAAFYAAVHLIEAFLAAHRAKHSISHQVRNATVKEDSFLRGCHLDFRVLFNASLIARYLSDEPGKEYASFSDYMRPEDVFRELADTRLKRIREKLQQYIA